MVGTAASRFDAEQRGLMTDSAAVEDSDLPGFNDSWPCPSSSRRPDSDLSHPIPTCLDSTSDRSDAEGEAGARSGGARVSDRLHLPRDVCLKHAVQVWNALRVFPRPMGMRPPPSLESLLRAIVTLCPRWVPGRSGGGGGADVNGK